MKEQYFNPFRNLLFVFGNEYKINQLITINIRAKGIP